VIARRYARALLELSYKENNSGSVRKEMAAIGGLMRQKKYFKFFTNRLVHAGEKLGALASLSPLTRDFLRLVIANKREEYLYLISKEYIDLLNKRNNVIDVSVSSKVPMTAGQRTKLRRKLERSLLKKININFMTDRKIIGGFCVRYGDSVIDGTVSGLLNGYLRRLTGE
jgi:F-type H+-transporting ATPase subunit delta